jgi:class 3 adenylate cyclase
LWGGFAGGYVERRGRRKRLPKRHRRGGSKAVKALTPYASIAYLEKRLDRRTNERDDALEQLAATSDVLKIISHSQFNLQVVFDTLVESATRLCRASSSVLWRPADDGRYHLVSDFGVSADYKAHLQSLALKPDGQSVVGRCLQAGKIIYVPDLSADPDYRKRRLTEFGGYRGLLCVPLLRQDLAIGVLMIAHTSARKFSSQQIALAATFANQAVIAIENTRLLNDLNKLNQQLEHRVTEQVNEIERMSRLRRFLPQQVADLIVASGSERQLESHRSEIAALFCDLRGFTGFSESSDPEDVIALLREYHASIGAIINRYGGTLERFAGDGVMVVFNDPVPIDKPALQAVLMAIDLRMAIGGLIEKWRNLGHDIGYGIGIAHGFATLGTIGFEGRFDYSAIGTVCNVASRLCDEAKSGQILITPRVFSAVGNEILVEQAGDFSLKGIRRPVTAYNVLATKAAN